MKLGIYVAVLALGLFAVMAFTTEPNKTLASNYGAMAQDITEEECPCEVVDSLTSIFPFLIFSTNKMLTTY